MGWAALMFEREIDITNFLTAAMFLRNEGFFIHYTELKRRKQMPTNCEISHSKDGKNKEKTYQALRHLTASWRIIRLGSSSAFDMDCKTYTLTISSCTVIIDIPFRGSQEKNLWWFSCCWCYYNNNIFDIKILVDRTRMYQTERTWNFDNKIRGRRFHHLTIVFKRNIEIHACSNRTAKCKHIPQKRMQIQEDQQTSWRKWGHDNFLYGINHRHNMDMHRNLYLSSQGINSCVGKVRHSNKALYGCLSNSLKISRNVYIQLIWQTSG